MSDIVGRSRRVIAISVLAVLLVGPPVALGQWTRVSWRFSLSALEALVTRPDEIDVRRVLVALFVGALWMHWGRFVVAVGVESWGGRHSRRAMNRHPSNRPPSFLRTFAATVVAAAGIVAPHGDERAAGAAPSVAVTPPALVVHGGGLDLAWSDTGFMAGGIVVFLESIRRHRMRTSRRGASGRTSDAVVAEQSMPVGHAGPIDEPEFVIRLLGPVDIVDRHGESVPIERRKSLELLAWLTVHRRQAARDGARTALWEHDISDASFTNVVSEARRALRRHRPPPEGTDWIERSSTGVLRLHHRVANDVDLFRTRLERAHRAGGPDAYDGLRAALGTVRGVPFLGSGWTWADAEGLTTDLTMLIVDTSLELAERSLADDRLVEALDATSVGLSVLPGQEELVGVRFRIHARAGDLAGLRHEWRTYERSVASDPWQTGPTDWLAALYRRLVTGEAAQ